MIVLVLLAVIVPGLNDAQPAIAKQATTHRPICITAQRYANCPNNWRYYKNPPICYYGSGAFRNFSASQEFCQTFSDGAEIAVTFNRDMTFQLKADLRRMRFLWLALNDYDGNEKWIWSYDDVLLNETSFEYWTHSKRNPRTRNYLCAEYDTHHKNWTDTPCSYPIYVLCQRVAKGDYCDEGWDNLGSLWCVKLINEKMDWKDAKRRCLLEKGFLMYIPDQETSDLFKEYFIKRHTTWIGIKKDDDSDKWRWSTGRIIAPDELNWGHMQPGSDPNKKCASLLHYGMWEAIECDRKLPVACINSVQDGPSYTTMYPRFHRRDNVFLKDVNLTSICTAIGTDKADIKWTIMDGNSIFDVREEFVENTNGVVQTKKGLCVNKTTSVLKHPGLAVTSDAKLSCFAGVKRPYCRYITNLRLDCAWVPFRVLGGAATLRNLTLEYLGHPGPVKSKAVVTAECTVSIHPGQDGLLMWVLFDRDNSSFIIKNDDPRVKRYDKDEINHEIRSTLEVTFRYQMSGSSIGCFAYDVESLNTTLKCPDDDIYCGKTIPIKVKSNPIEGRNWFSLKHFGIFLILLVVCLLWLSCIKTLRDMSQRQEGRVLAYDVPEPIYYPEGIPQAVPDTESASMVPLPSLKLSTVEKNPPEDNMPKPNSFDKERRSLSIRSRISDAMSIKSYGSYKS